MDVVAFNPETKDLILCELKAHGKSSTIKTLASLITDTSTFRNSIEKILKNDLIKNINPKSLTIHIVANIGKKDEFEIAFEDNKYSKGNNEKTYFEEHRLLLEEIVQKISIGKANPIKKVRLKVESLFSVMTSTIKNIASHEKEDIKEFQKRYGNLTLDIAREINRYLSYTKHHDETNPYRTISPNFKMLFESLGVDPLILCKYFLDLKNGSESEKELGMLLQKVSDEKSKKMD